MIWTPHSVTICHSEVNNKLQIRRVHISLIKAAGNYLAKLVFSIHGIDKYDKCKLRKTIKKNNLLAKMEKLPPCIVGMKACSCAHYWASEFTKLGHDVRIMASKFVIPYRQSEKNDANDAEAIFATRSKTRFVSIKSAEQQAVLCLHRVRQGASKT